MKPARLRNETLQTSAGGYYVPCDAPECDGRLGPNICEKCGGSGSIWIARAPRNWYKLAGDIVWGFCLLAFALTIVWLLRGGHR